MSVAYEEASKWITAKALELGVKISDDQLADWHRAGLIPEPQRGFPGGGGSVSIYPRGTVQQAVACAALMKRHKDYSVVGWGLWLRGFTVREHFWRSAFYAGHCLFVEFSSDAFREGEFTDQLETGMDQVASMRRPRAFLGKIMRKVGRAGFRKLMPLLMSVAVGAYERKLYDPNESELDENLFARMIAVIPGAKKKSAPPARFLPDSGPDIADRLAQISSVIGELASPEFLNAWTINDFNAARDDFKFGFGAYAHFRKIEETISTQRSFGILILREMLTATRRAQALFILMWSLCLDQIPGWRERFEALKAQSKDESGN